MGVAYREGVVLHKYCVWHGHMIRLAGHDSGLVSAQVGVACITSLQ